MPNELGYCEIYKPRCHGILNRSEYNNDPYIKKIYSSLLYLYGITSRSFLNENSTEREEWETTVIDQYSLWRFAGDSGHLFVSVEFPCYYNQRDRYPDFDYRDFYFDAYARFYDQFYDASGFVAGGGTAH